MVPNTISEISPLFMAAFKNLFIIKFPVSKQQTTEPIQVLLLELYRIPATSNINIMANAMHEFASLLFYKLFFSDNSNNNSRERL